MNYPGVLEAVARLHVDLRFRAAFAADPEAALARLGLPEEARRALARLDGAILHRIARVADHHRVTRVGEQFPWLDPGLRPDLWAHLGRYMAEVPPRLLNRDEAIAFCRHVEANPPPDPPYLAELARYERLRLEIAWGVEGAQSRVEAFRYPLIEILAAMKDPGWPAAPARPTWLEIKKVPQLPAVVTRALPADPRPPA